MAEVNGFHFNTETGDIKMYAGDTGSCLWGCEIEGGDEWPSTGRGLWTVTAPSGEIVMQRIYRFEDGIRSTTTTRTNGSPAPTGQSGVSTLRRSGTGRRARPGA